MGNKKMSSTTQEVYLRTKGILPIQKLRILSKAGIISSKEGYPIQDDQFQPNSIDLRLGEIAYRVRCSFLPEDETVDQKLKKLSQYEVDITDGAILEPNSVYIIPLLEILHLPSHISPQKTLFDGSEEDTSYRIVSGEHLAAKANPKSTTGRLDVFTRVITDYSHRFEEIRSGYKGGLYLEVVPKSFPIRVKTGHRLNQLRLRHGYTVLSDQDILRTHSSNPLLFKENGQPVPVDDLKVNEGLFLSVNLHGNEGQVVGYKAKKHRDYIDLDNINYYNVPEFWEPIYAQQDDHLILEPEAFYIFASKERCRIPEHLAAEMIAYDTGSGELRTHYAGFFDSGFGGRIEDKGARAVLEVRSHDVPFLIEDGQTFCSMKFEPNTEIPETIYGKDIKSNYQGQDLKLGKHFKQD
ncbi:2'-deoxycytidine 5'-triphosphate deaminase [Aliifodinibius salicampi]|uniref:2'-deoxycytidine 5'-triphosphate deaminase n=1 Tax=Fodinibius salicampi TaxID=1920655 RepID=A0ABT3PU30_9BACT|nr:2'-deoxycytidine 5'-triphosphate deaminase [Fodinibius salicampi]MCW9711363.1 2'-deoxycytidine 5'-triphosphate deaminase [Fodinibius salicampi]